jgi:hypothetical protein
MNEVHMSEELFFGVSPKTGSLYTRNGRPLYATTAEWVTLSEAMQPTSLVSAMAVNQRGQQRLIFGALPMFNQGAPDIIDAVITAISNLTVADLARLTGTSGVPE